MDGGENARPETDNETLKRSDVEVVYNGPLGTVTIPRSHEASCELGSGTKWCTTGRDDYYYNSYSEDGDLIIYNEKPGNNKYQIHATLGGIEIRDARDRDISSDKFREFTGSHPVLSRLIKKKSLEAFTDKAQEDPGWLMYDHGDEYLDNMIELVHGLIDHNIKHRVGVMTYVETYYTQEFFHDRPSKRNHKGDYEMDYLVKYAEQRGKPWPEIQPLVVKYIQQKLADLQKQAQNTFRTEEAKQLLILIKQFKRLKNPWPELDAIQAQLEGKGISNTPGDINIESVDLSDIRV